MSFLQTQSSAFWDTQSHQVKGYCVFSFPNDFTPQWLLILPLLLIRISVPLKSVYKLWAVDVLKIPGGCSVTATGEGIIQHIPMSCKPSALQDELLQHPAKPPFPFNRCYHQITQQHCGCWNLKHKPKLLMSINSSNDVRGYPNVMEKT